MKKSDRRILYNALNREWDIYKKAVENDEDELFEKLCLKNIQIIMNNLLEMYPDENKQEGKNTMTRWEERSINGIISFANDLKEVREADNMTETIECLKCIMSSVNRLLKEYAPTETE